MPNPFGAPAIAEDEEEDYADGASTPETVDEALDGFAKEAADPTLVCVCVCVCVCVYVKLRE